MVGRSVVNLKRIATEANLSIPTVSRILSGKDRCTPETRDRVSEIAKRLRYRPNLLVRGIQSGKTGSIGVLVHISDEFFARMAEGIHDGLVAADRVPIFLWSKGNSEAAPTELQQLHRLVDRRVDGIILHPRQDSVDEAYLREVWDRNLPLVTIDRELAATHADFVGTDDAAGARLAAEHLLSLGHRRLGHLSGPRTVTTAYWRANGFEKGAAEAGLSVNIIEDASYGRDSFAPAKALLDRPDRPTAVFCANDFQVAAVYLAAAELGLSIPRDLSVVGFADLSVAGALLPRLTTLHQRPEEMGVQAARYLNDRIDGTVLDPAPRRVQLKPELIVRQSTGPARQ